LRTPPPHSTIIFGGAGTKRSADRMPSAVKAQRVAAASSSDKAATGAGSKASRSSDFGGSSPK